MPAEFANQTQSSPAAAQPWRAISAPPIIQLSSAHLAERMGRTLLLVPHYDDECAAGVLLRKLPEATVLFLTDGAPRDPYFWRRYGTREHYSSLRKRESVETLQASGIHDVLSLDDIPGSKAPADQELYRALPEAFQAVKAVATRFLPKTILAPAYEGGHPDHDAAAFLAAEIARHVSAQHWELPYYHRKADGKVYQQEFLQHLPSACEVTLALSEAEIQQKRAMWSRYQSQCAVLQEFAVEREIYRPAPPYTWQRPPHPGTLNYEAWRWAATGGDLCAAFQSALSVIG